jgi:D-alanine-D-alanine ligase
MKIVTLHDVVGAGALPDETDALVQAEAVAIALRSLGHATIDEAATLDLESLAARLRIAAPDLVFNLVESLSGHGRLIHLVPALLDSLELPYTGAPSDAIFATSNKLIAKQMLTGAGIPTPEWTTPDHRSDRAFRPGRYILKSVWEHASRGLDDDSIIEADSPETLHTALVDQADRLAGSGFAERFIEGREFNLAMLASVERSSTSSGAPAVPEVLPPAEIVFEGYGTGRARIVNYRAKWDASSFEFHHTPRRYDFPPSDDRLLAELKDLALRCWRLFNLRGYARVDFRVETSAADSACAPASDSASASGGRPWVLEVNANPCLSPDAGFAAALERARIPFAAAIRRIIGDVTVRKTALDGPGCKALRTP